MSARVRRRRANHFAAVPYGVARNATLSDSAFRMWVVLMSHADWDDASWQITHRTLAVECGWSVRKVQRAIDELTEAGLLEFESGRSVGAPNFYTVVEPPEGTTPMSDLLGHPCPTSSDTHVVPGTTPVSDITRTSLPEPTRTPLPPIADDVQVLTELAFRQRPSPTVSRRKVAGVISTMLASHHHPDTLRRTIEHGVSTWTVSAFGVALDKANPKRVQRPRRDGVDLSTEDLYRQILQNEMESR